MGGVRRLCGENRVLPESYVKGNDITALLSWGGGTMKRVTVGPFIPLKSCFGCHGMCVDAAPLNSVRESGSGGPWEPGPGLVSIWPRDFYGETLLYNSREPGSELCSH